MLGFKLTVGSGTNTLTIDGNASEEIEWRGVATTTLLLYVVGDYVWLLCDGTRWRVVGDGIIPHCCKLYQGASQNITNGSQPTILLDTIEKDVGGLADTANNRIVVRRAAIALVQAYGAIASGMATDTEIWTAPCVGGNSISWGLMSAGTNPTAATNISLIRAFAAGAIITQQTYQNSGGTRATSTTEPYRHWLSYTELVALPA